MSKTISISDTAYITLKSLADAEARTLTAQFDVVLNQFSQRTSSAPSPAQSAKGTERRLYEDDPEWGELLGELKDLENDFAENTDNEEAAAIIVKEIGEVKAKMEKIKSKY